MYWWLIECLNVDTNGCGDGEVEYISCFISILPGL